MLGRFFRRDKNKLDDALVRFVVVEDNNFALYGPDHQLVKTEPLEGLKSAERSVGISSETMDVNLFQLHFIDQSYLFDGRMAGIQIGFQLAIELSSLKPDISETKLADGYIAYSFKKSV